MKRSTVLFSIAATSLCLCCVFATAQRKKFSGYSISTGSERTIRGCDQVSMRIDDREILRSELTQSVPRSAIASLQVRAADQGGVHVQGWDGDHYAIKACIGATSENPVEAERMLKQITLSVENGVVSVNGPASDGSDRKGPDGRGWMAYLIIQAPNGAALNLEAKNAPIGISDFAGKVEARNQNGPLSLYDVGGRIQADVLNGPINLTGNRGDHRLKVQNGPLTVNLTGTRWDEGELEGHTQNGPLTLKLPTGYQSGVRVDGSEHSPFQCRAEQCKETARSWDQPNRFELGGPTPVIRLSTVNGPTTIK